MLVVYLRNRRSAGPVTPPIDIGDSISSSLMLDSTASQFLSRTFTAISPTATTGGSGPNEVCVSAEGNNVYVICSNGGGFGTSKLSQYVRDTNTGALASIGDITPATVGGPLGICISAVGGTTVTGINPLDIAISADGAFVYLSNFTGGAAGTISMYSRNTSTGVLTALSPATIATGNGPQGICIAPDGTSVYVANNGSNTVTMFTRNVGTGALTNTLGSIATGTGPFGITISADGTSVYVPNYGAGVGTTLQMYSRNVVGGALTSLGTVATGTGPIEVNITADGTSVYVTNYGAANGTTLSQYSRNTGTGLLTALSTPTIATGTAPLDIAISADGTNVYVSDSVSHTIHMYSRNISTGALTVLAPTSIGTSTTPFGICISPNGASIYICNFAGSATSIVMAYSRNTSTGLLTLIGTSTSVYVTNNGSNNTSMYSRNTGTGQLTALGTPTIATGTGPFDICISTDGLHVYCTNNSDNTVSQYSRNAGTGALTALSPATIATGTGPIGITISTDGTSVYVCNFGTTTISQYSRNVSTGLLTALGTVAAGTNPKRVCISTDGTSVYASNSTSNNVSQYSRNVSTGLLTGLGTVAAGTTAAGICISADGTSVYVTNRGGATITEFSRSGGVLAGLATIATNTGPEGIAISVDGKSVYECNFNVNTGTTLGVYVRDTSTGILATITAAFQSTFTLSCWVKRGKINTVQNIFGVSTNNSLGFTAANTLQLILAGTIVATSVALFRDPAAWYHVTYVQTGTTNTLYINNVVVASGSTASGVFNTAVAHQFGATNTLNFTDGYVANLYFIDGQALTPSSFGRVSSDTGAWLNKTYTGTYGINGFTLPFTNSAALGTDSSGLGNNWTLNGGITSVNQYTDTPTNNFNIFNILDRTTTATLTKGNTTTNPSTVAIGSIGMTSGKFYWEVSSATAITSAGMYGIAPTTLVSIAAGQTRSLRFDVSAGTLDSTVSNGLTALSPATVATGTTPRYVCVSADGNHVYITDNGVNTVHMYSRNTSTGILTVLGTPTIPTGSLPNGICISGDGNHVYVVNNGDATVSMYSRNTGTGQLTALAPPTITTGVASGPNGICISADGTSVYVTNTGAGTVAMYSRNISTGQLTALGSPTIASGTSPTGICISVSGTSVYVTNFGDNTVTMFTRNVGTGALTNTLGTIGTGTGPRGIAISVDGNSVYVANGTSTTISMYSRNTGTGQLTALVPATIATGTTPLYLVVSADGTSVYVTDNGASTVHMYSRNISTGLLTVLSPTTIATGAGPYGIAISADGNSVYVNNSTGVTLSQISRNSWVNFASGLTSPPYFVYVSTAATAIATLNSGSKSFTTTLPAGYVALNTFNLALPTTIKPSLYFDVNVYTGNATSVVNTIGFAPDLIWLKSRSLVTDNCLVDSVRGITKLLISDTTAAEVTNANIVTATTSSSYTVGNDTKVNTNLATYAGWSWKKGAIPGMDVQIFTAPAASSANIATGTNPIGVCISTDGLSVYVTNNAVGGGTTLTRYSRNTGTGALTSQGTTTTGTGPFDMCIAPDGTSVYVVNNAANSVSQYSRNVVGGALTPLAPATVATGATPIGIAISADGLSVYVCNYNNGAGTTLTRYARNSGSGLLTSQGTTATGTGPYSICIAPDGTSVYVTNYGVGDGTTLQMYSRNVVGGALTSLGTVATGTSPIGVCISADGTSVYVANDTTNTINMYSRNTGTGLLTALSPATITTGVSSNPFGIIISGNASVYVANNTTNTIGMFSRDTGTGLLTALSPATIVTDTAPFRLVVAADGTSVYSTNNGINTLGMYSRDTSSGLLSPLGTLQVTHTLGVTPAMAIAKCRGTTSEWSVYHKNLTTPTTDRLVLNTTAAFVTTPSAWFPTSSNMGLVIGTTAVATQTGVLYLFAEITGFSKFGSYLGNANTDGTFVYCGFRPRFVMTKCISTTGDWRIHDGLRPGFNRDVVGAGGTLLANSTAIETTTAEIDMTSTGFKCRVAADPNSAQTFVFAAFAEMPFKYSNAR